MKEIGLLAEISSWDATGFMYNITNITSKNVYFQDGSPTVNYGTKGYKRSIEGLHLGYTKNKQDWNSTTRRWDITGFM